MLHKHILPGFPWKHTHCFWVLAVGCFVSLISRNGRAGESCFVPSHFLIPVIFRTVLFQLKMDSPEITQPSKVLRSSKAAVSSVSAAPWASSSQYLSQLCSLALWICGSITLVLIWLQTLFFPKSFVHKTRTWVTFWIITIRNTEVQAIGPDYFIRGPDGFCCIKRLSATCDVWYWNRWGLGQCSHCLMLD